MNQEYMAALENSISIEVDSNNYENALKLIYLAAEVDKNEIVNYKWYLLMIQVASMAHKVGRFNPDVILHRPRWGGLCNRLFSLASAFIYSDSLKGIPFICWTQSAECPYLIHNIIKLPDAKYINAIQALELVRLNVDRVAWTGAWAMEARMYEMLPLNPMEKSDFNIKIDKFISNLQFSDFIDARVNEFKHAYDWDDSIIGVHIRYTDNIPHYTNRGLGGELSTYESFILKIEEEIAKGCVRFFISADSMESILLLKKIFGNKIFTRVKNFDSRNFRQTTVEDAVIDLILLSKTKKIIGSKISSFNQFAATMGRIELVLA